MKTYVFWLLSQPLPHLRFNVCHISRPSYELLYTTNTSNRKRKHFFMNILCIESFWPQNTHNRTMFFGSILVKHCRHFDYWNQPLNMRMLVSYLDCHEAGPCCYIAIHIENLLRPLELFYFHLWSIYWLSFVLTKHCLLTFMKYEKWAKSSDSSPIRVLKIVLKDIV
jgi:hypothetical protein